jgi:hypothetical protein
MGAALLRDHAQGVDRGPGLAAIRGAAGYQVFGHPLSASDLGTSDRPKIGRATARSLAGRNEEFTDYQIHNDFPKLIPRDEIWLGRNVDAKERPILS